MVGDCAHRECLTCSRNSHLHSLDEVFGDALLIDAALAAIQKNERVRCVRAMICRTLYDAFLSCSSTEVHERDRGAYVKVKRLVSQSMEGQEDDIIVICIYFCLSR